jgi:hypothetical protein
VLGVLAAGVVAVPGPPPAVRSLGDAGQRILLVSAPRALTDEDETQARRLLQRPAVRRDRGGQPIIQEGSDMDAAFMTTAEVAKLLKTSESTVRWWRHSGYGPPGIKIGKRVLYPVPAESEWLDALQRSTDAA